MRCPRRCACWRSSRPAAASTARWRGWRRTTCCSAAGRKIAASPGRSCRSCSPTASWRCRPPSRSPACRTTRSSRRAAPRRLPQGECRSGEGGDRRAPPAPARSSPPSSPTIVVNRLGPVLPFELAEETGSASPALPGAYAATDAIFDLAGLWTEIEQAEVAETERLVLLNIAAGGVRLHMADIHPATARPDALPARSPLRPPGGPASSGWMRRPRVC